MPRRLSFVCDEEVAERVESLARRHGIPTEEALRQVVEAGLEEIEERP